jgi:hypothetical protein
MKRRFLRRLLTGILLLPTLLLLAVLLQRDSYLPATSAEKTRLVTAPYEFEFVSWTLNALWEKTGQFLLGEERYMSPAGWHSEVISYNRLLDEIHASEAELEHIFADPSVADPYMASASLRDSLAAKRSTLAGRQPLVEAILQEQAASELRREGFGVGGEVFPPVLFRFSPIPAGLIISPREVIRQDANIQLIPGLTLEQRIALEQEVEQRLNVSALVENLGGLGTFPTMIMETSWLNWVAEAVLHEWTHLYLYPTPLGLMYEVSPDMRTVNETAASLTGKTLGARLIEDYYPELMPPPPATATPSAADPQPVPQEPVFNLTREMHTTRVEADRLLAEGRIEEAEQYLEERRQFLAEHGVYIRRLNQAYFAFHGAYADVPGERGEDPIGPAVTELFNQCPTVRSFLDTVSQVTSFSQLQELVAAGTCG